MAIISLISVMGMITNPVMIARTILEDSYSERALQQQMIAAFMTAASNALSCVVATRVVLWVCVDSEHHIRANCINTCPHALFRAIGAIISIVGPVWLFVMSSIQRFLQDGVRIGNDGYPEPPSEHQLLLN